MASQILVPMSALPQKQLMPLAHRLIGIGDFVYALAPSLADDLQQAEIELSAREYAAAAFINASIYGITIGILAFTLALRAANITNPLQLAAITIAAAGVVGLAILATIIAFPKITVAKKSRALEAELIPATRQLMIELKSGVPLFNAMASVSSDYGEVSREFQKITKKINSGVHEINALADATRENPSTKFRKVLWQISNALKVGSDVAKALEIIIKELEKDKVDQIRKYGQELSPWTMAYMMVAVVLPSLGITMLIVITSFIGGGLPKITLPLLLVGLVGFQIFFINFVSTRRPSI